MVINLYVLELSMIRVASEFELKTTSMTSCTLVKFSQPFESIVRMSVTLQILNEQKIPFGLITIKCRSGRMNDTKKNRQIKIGVESHV
jgi:hypothetical protein